MYQFSLLCREVGFSPSCPSFDTRDIFLDFLDVLFGQPSGSLAEIIVNISRSTTSGIDRLIHQVRVERIQKGSEIGAIPVPVRVSGSAIVVSKLLNLTFANLPLMKALYLLSYCGRYTLFLQACVQCHFDDSIESSFQVE